MIALSAIHRRAWALLLGAVACALPAVSAAQSKQDAAAYPARPIRLVVPFPAGASPNCYAWHPRMRLGLTRLGAIAIGARVKRPGDGLTGQPVELLAVPSSARTMDAYERLLGDALDGDATLFARQDVVEAAWAIVDPLLHLPPTGLHIYEPGTWGPAEADRLAADVGGWNTPR